jgi:hypothetical protein
MKELQSRCCRMSCLSIGFGTICACADSDAGYRQHQDADPVQIILNGTHRENFTNTGLYAVETLHFRRPVPVCRTPTPERW